MAKRLFDIVLSVQALLVLSLPLLVIAVLIKLEDGSPVFYRGKRIGLHGKFFRIFKFRTMLVDAEKLGASSTSDDDKRITGIGKFLRKYKLDELPQLINVLIEPGRPPAGSKTNVLRQAALWSIYRSVERAWLILQMLSTGLIISHPFRLKMV